MNIAKERELLDAFAQALRNGDAEQAREALIAFYTEMGLY